MNEAKARQIVEAWCKTGWVDADTDALISALADAPCEECDKLQFQLYARTSAIEGKDGWREESQSLRARIAKLEVALRDAPDHSDLDAAVFEANLLAGELERANQHIATLESEYRDLVSDIAIELDDLRMRYLTAQISRAAWEPAKKIEAQLAKKEKLT